MPKKSKSKKQGVVARAKTTTAPAAIGSKVAGATVPKIQNANDGSATISHQEYCFDVVSAGANTFNSSLNPVNPQRTALFTWLSALATRYEMYRFKKLKFHYKPSSGTSTDGYVVMGFDFDAYDQDPAFYGTSTDFNGPGKAEVLTWKYSQKSAPWQPMTLDVSADSRISTFRYCDIGTRGDKRLDILGNFLVLTDRFSTGQKFCGEIFVEYTVEFRSPAYKIPPALYAQYIGSGSMSAANAWFNSASNFFGNMDIKLQDLNSLIVNEVGDFLLELSVSATSGISSAPAVNISAYNAGRVTVGAEKAANTTTSAIRTVPFSVEVPPVFVDFGDVNGTGVVPTVRFTTFKANY